MIGAAVSTTGDYWRMGFLETSVSNWLRVLGDPDSLVVTVDGDEEAAMRARAVVPDEVAVIAAGKGHNERDGHQGVAVNKNTGLSYLMRRPTEHLFLCDDDTHPRSPESLRLHTSGLPHSMVCWGAHRMSGVYRDHARWSWPRGVLLYVRREVVEAVGGMVEGFGYGGHEHAEWSRRIYAAGFTPAPFCTPRQYADRRAKGAVDYWHGEDMKAPGETTTMLGTRRAAITSVKRQRGDWTRIHAMMERYEGSAEFVDYHELANGRGPAYFIESLGAEEPQ